MTKLNKVLAIVLGLQVVVAVIVLSRGSETVNLKQAPLLAGFDAAQVTRLQVFDGRTDKPIDLVKRGDAWLLASQWDYPVDKAKLDAALAPLATLTAGDPITTSASKYKQLKVGDTDFDKKLVITAGGKDTTVFIGTTKSRRTAMRLAGDERVLGVSGFAAGSFSGVAHDWIARDYSAIARDDIEKVTIERGATKVELDRTSATAEGSGSDSGSAAPKERTWRLAIDGAPVTLATGEKLDTFAIDTIVSDVATIDASPADPKRDASKPAAVISVTKKDGTTVVFDVVAEGDTSWWIKQRGNERATTVDKTRLESVMGADRGKLVTKPVATKPGAGKSPLAPIVPPPPHG